MKFCQECGGSLMTEQEKKEQEEKKAEEEKKLKEEGDKKTDETKTTEDNTPAMVDCFACGAPNPQGAKFCKKCGISLATKECPACNRKNAADAIICQWCGHDYNKAKERPSSLKVRRKSQYKFGTETFDNFLKEKGNTDFEMMYTNSFSADAIYQWLEKNDLLARHTVEDFIIEFSSYLKKLEDKEFQFFLRNNNSQEFDKIKQMVNDWTSKKVTNWYDTADFKTKLAKLWQTVGKLWIKTFYKGQISSSSKLFLRGELMTLEQLQNQVNAGDTARFGKNAPQTLNTAEKNCIRDLGFLSMYVNRSFMQAFKVLEASDMPLSPQDSGGIDQERKLQLMSGKFEFMIIKCFCLFYAVKFIFCFWN